MNFPLSCTICGKPYVGPIDEYVCTYCGGSIEPLVDLKTDPEGLKNTLRKGSENGIWGYRKFLPVSDDITPITRGEGNTPLVKTDRLSKEYGLDYLYIKNETVNPTGSYKDRFATVAISLEKVGGAKAVALGSAGNAAAAVSAYSAVAGIKCFILLPPGAAQERAWQNMSYGGRFIRAVGHVNDAIDLVVAGTKAFGWRNVCTTMLHHPYGAEGYKTIAYEVARSMDFDVPDYILCPVGGGILISKIYRAYTEMFELGLIDRLPRMVAVQAEGCAPIVKAFEEKAKKTEFWTDARTIASSINDPVTFEGVTALDVLYRSNGFAVSVTDEDILAAMRIVASREAILAEPASATVMAATKNLVANGTFKRADKIVCVATGSALRDLKMLAGDMPQAPQVGQKDLNELAKAVAFYGGIPR